MKIFIAICFLSVVISIGFITKESGLLYTQIPKHFSTPTPANVVSNLLNMQPLISDRNSINNNNFPQHLTENKKSNKNEDKKTVFNKIYAEETNFIQKAKIKRLKKTVLTDGEKELRVLVLDWYLDFAIREPEMFILSFKENKWEATAIKLNADRKIETRNLGTPISGWEDWKIFIENKINPVYLRNIEEKTETEAVITIFESKSDSDYAKKIVFQKVESKAGLFLEFFSKLKKDFNLLQNTQN